MKSAFKIVWTVLLGIGSIATLTVMLTFLVHLVVGNTIVAEVPVFNEEQDKIVHILPIPEPSASPSPKAYRLKVKQPRIIVLREDNTISLRTAVTKESVAKVEIEAYAKSSNLSASEPLYLVLDTPGGDVTAGRALMDSLKSLNRKVPTITLFAASMGFHLAQNMDDRLITPSGTLMSHRIRIGGLDGQIPGEATTRLNAITRTSTIMDEIVATRVGMDLNDYQELIRDEYWVEGSDAVAYHMADEVVLPRCSPEMLRPIQQSVQTLFGGVVLTMSACPLISGPIAIDTSGIHNPFAVVFIKMMYLNKRSFVEKYITTNKYVNYL